MEAHNVVTRRVSHILLEIRLPVDVSFTRRQPFTPPPPEQRWY
jgi:hypothetical protein